MERENKTVHNSLVDMDTTTINGEVVINGDVIIGDGANVPFLIASKAENVAYAAGSAPTAAEFKSLIDALIAAGVMAAPAE